MLIIFWFTASWVVKTSTTRSRCERKTWRRCGLQTDDRRLLIFVIIHIFVRLLWHGMANFQAFSFPLWLDRTTRTWWFFYELITAWKINVTTVHSLILYSRVEFFYHIVCNIQPFNQILLQVCFYRFVNLSMIQSIFGLYYVIVHIFFTDLNFVECFRTKNFVCLSTHYITPYITTYCMILKLCTCFIHAFIHWTYILFYFTKSIVCSTKSIVVFYNESISWCVWS